jgi:glucokinase
MEEPMSAKANRKYWVGFDLGGTKMLAAVFDEGFEPLAKKRKRTRAQDGAAGGLKRMIGLIETTLAEAGIGVDGVAGIGVGCPGPLDLDRGIILETPNLGWKKIRVRAELEKAFGCPVVIANDVDAGVYGEYRLGAARAARCVVGVFPGTGVGGGAVYNGEIIRGAKGSCVEIGHLPVVRDGPLCGCGRRGCLEAVAGRLAISAAAAIAAYRGEAPHLLAKAGTDVARIRSRALCESIAAGDTAVENIVREAARTIGWAMAGVVNLLAPDVVLLGGGLVEDMPKLFQEEVSAAVNARVMPSYENSFEVVVAELTGDATITGAAAWAQQTVEGRSG